MTAASLPRPIGESDPATARNARLRAGMRTVRTRASSQDLERALLVIGGILMPLGVLFIILGWVGSSKTPLTFEQNDYLISGGILGLALVIAGGFTYFSYWQTVRIRESRAQAYDMAAAFQRLETAIITGIGTVGDVGGSAAALHMFVATQSGSMFHRRDCTTVAGRDDLLEVDASITSLRPCRICNPLD